MVSQSQGRTSMSKQWTGPQDGLPPAGIKCEFSTGNGEWVRVFTVGLDDDGHVVVQRKNHGYDCSMNPEHFRPIRTPEQISSEERGKAIDAMYACWLTSEGGFRVAIEALYDAGYRKQPIQSAEDMSDPLNWKKGDVVVAIHNFEDQFSKGGLYVLREDYNPKCYTVRVELDDRNTKNGWGPDNFRWHSRPSADSLGGDV